MRFRAPEYYDSDEDSESGSDSESESESDSTPAAPPTPPRIRELHILTKKRQAKHKRSGKGMIGVKRFEAYRDAYLARRRGQHGQGPSDLEGEEERKGEHAECALSRESAAPMMVDIGNPLACGLGCVFDDLVRNLAGGSGNGNGDGSPFSGSYIAPGAFPGLSMIDSDND